MDQSRGTIVNRPLVILGPAIAEPGKSACPLYVSPVQAGWPSPGEDYAEEKINLHKIAVKNPPATFFLRAAGDSMLGCGIHDGDLLVVDRSLDARHNRVVIAALDRGLVIKRLIRRKNRVYLAPANPKYPEIDITTREYVHIWGIVTYVLHKL